MVVIGLFIIKVSKSHQDEEVEKLAKEIIVTSKEKSQPQEELIEAPAELLETVGYKGMFFGTSFCTFRDNLEGEEEATTLVELVLNILQGYFGWFNGDIDDGPCGVFIRRSIAAFGEALMNAAEHGNCYDPTKTITFGMWLGEGGVLFAIQDEGDFLQRDGVKEKIEARIHFPSTRKDGPGGDGMECIYEADVVKVLGDVLFLAVLLPENAKGVR